MNVQHSIGKAGALRDLDDRRDVGDDRARGAVGRDLQPLRRRSPAPAARRRGRRAARRRAGRCRRCRCRADRSGGGSRASGRWSGTRTDGDCRPSRSVSSLSMTGRGGRSAVRFQSWMSGCIFGIGQRSQDRAGTGVTGRSGSRRADLHRRDTVDQRGEKDDRGPQRRDPASRDRSRGP